MRRACATRWRSPCAPPGAAAWLAAGNDAIDAASPVDEQRRLRGHIAAVGSLVAATNGEYRRSIDLAQEADALLPEGSALRLIVPFALGHARPGRRRPGRR